MISVIMPAYNAENFISEAIKSVLSQSYQDFEVIIIDDGSKDNTKRVIESFNDPRITYLYQENSGPAAARNTGLNIAKGEYIAFLDVDDIWLPSKLETQLSIIKSQKDICMVYSSFIIRVKQNGNVNVIKFKNYKRQDFIKNLLIDPFKTIPYPSSVMIKKSYLDEVGYFRPDLYTGEDWDLWLRLALRGECKYINQELAIRNVHEESLTGSMKSHKQKYYHCKVLKSFFDNNPEYENLKSKAYSAIYQNFVIYYFYRNKKKPTKNVYMSLLKSYKLNPFIIFAEIKNIKFLLSLLLRTIMSKLNYKIYIIEDRYKWKSLQKKDL